MISGRSFYGILQCCIAEFSLAEFDEVKLLIEVVSIENVYKGLEFVVKDHVYFSF